MMRVIRDSWDNIITESLPITYNGKVVGKAILNRDGYIAYIEDNDVYHMIKQQPSSMSLEIRSINGEKV